MSVKACGRAGCHNVMCDRTILGAEYYLCDDCFDELLAWKNRWPKMTRPSAVRGLILEFIDSDPGDYSDETVDGVFRQLVGE